MSTKSFYIATTNQTKYSSAERGLLTAINALLATKDYDLVNQLLDVKKDVVSKYDAVVQELLK